MRDEELLAQYLLTKDHDLFNALYERMHRRLNALALRLLGSPDDAGDVVQEVFCKLCELDPREFYPPAYNFLFRVLQNLVIDHRRHERGGPRTNMISLTSLRRRAEAAIMDEIKKGASPSEEPIDARAESGSERAEKQEVWERIRDAVDRLPPKYQEAIRLYYWQGQTIAETAEAMGIKTDAAETLIRRGRSRLREIFAEEDRMPQPLIIQRSKPVFVGELANAV